MQSSKVIQRNMRFRANAARNAEIATLHVELLKATQRLQSMLPIRRRVAELVIHDDRAIARVAIERLLRSKQLGERVCGLTGKAILVDRRPSCRESVVVEIRRAA